MKSHSTKAALLTPVVVLGCAPFAMAQAANDDKRDPSSPVELSPFLVEEQSNQGYYASQTLAGGRMKQDIKDLGTSIQVITKEFMDDLGVTGVDELFQYTTSTEVGGILGNYMGAGDNFDGETSTGDARRNPDGTTRVRGLAAPDRARNFFKTDIPFDSYNTDRVDINRGANSFLFGLGSPSGLTNTGMARARFRNSNEISTRIGSGNNDTPSYRGSFKINRVVKKDVLALQFAVLTDRTKYRQEPTRKDDDRLYGTLTFRPFKSQDTVITAHVERGKIHGNASDVLLPQHNLDTFLNDPVVGRLSFDTWGNLQRFAHVEGPTQAQWNALSAADKLRFAVRETPTANSIYNGNWGNGAYGLVYDGTNGRMPAFAYTAQYRAVDYAAGDPFFGPNRTTKGAPYNVYHGNRSDVNGPGWFDQGFLDLKAFDFSKATLAWDNDYYARDFVNYNVAIEQVFLKGRAGIEMAFDYQDLFRRDYASFNAGVSRVMLDVNETLWLPTNVNYTAGNVQPVRNPNYGRLFVMTKANNRTFDQQRAAGRFTGFVKYDFARHIKRPWLAKVLGNHTFTALADRSKFKERFIPYTYNSFGNPEPALHIGPPNARQASNAPRNVPLISYIGPPQLDAFTNRNFSLNDFDFSPAKYQLRLPDHYSIQKLSWNLGPDATNDNFGLDSRANGNERFVMGTFQIEPVPAKNSRMESTTVSSYALNGQSFFWNHVLVANTGFRIDRVKSWLNREPTLIGLDEIPDVSPEGFRAESGELVRTKAEIFGYGGVLNIPRGFARMPKWLRLSFHYNTSENFVPETSRVDQFKKAIDSPSGRSKDYGATVDLWNSKLVMRLNWYNSTLVGAGAAVSGLFNTLNANIFNHYGNLNANIRSVDANDDGVIDQSVRDAIVVNPTTGLTTDGMTRDQAVQALYPFLAKSREARTAIAPYLTDDLKAAYNYRMAPDGSSNTQAAGNVVDTQDIEARGFEAELVYNPTPNWRIAFNAAKQETILTNIMPRITALLNTLWLPQLEKYGDLDWNLPVEPLNGNNTRQQINATLLDYFAVKGQEGRPQGEQRKWRMNFVTRYQFSQGRLKGFSLGGSVRWEDSYAQGYPLINDPSGIVLPDVRHPWRSDRELSYDVMFGYRRRILGDKDWTAQINVRNLQNWNSDRVTITRRQPDGTPARARFDPPLQVLLTNTFRF
jgi:hypothetical protein